VSGCGGSRIESFRWSSLENLTGGGRKLVEFPWEGDEEKGSDEHRFCEAITVGPRSEVGDYFIAPQGYAQGAFTDDGYIHVAPRRPWVGRLKSPITIYSYTVMASASAANLVGSWKPDLIFYRHATGLYLPKARAPWRNTAGSPETFVFPGAAVDAANKYTIKVWPTQGRDLAIIWLENLMTTVMSYRIAGRKVRETGTSAMEYAVWPTPGDPTIYSTLAAGAIVSIEEHVKFDSMVLYGFYATEHLVTDGRFAIEMHDGESVD